MLESEKANKGHGMQVRSVGVSNRSGSVRAEGKTELVLQMADSEIELARSYTNE